MSHSQPDFEAIKQKQSAAWAAGDYSVLGVMLQIVGENLAESLDLRAGDKVLDVAAGNGNFSLAAARCWAEVTSTDYVPALLDAGKLRAKADGLDIKFQTADAENLPFDDGAFDVVGSTFGVMFAPDQPKSASELLRVCRSGGKIGMANWTPEGFLGSFFKIISEYVTVPASFDPPVLWGTKAFMQTHFAPHASDITIERKAYTFRNKSPEHWLEIFRISFGPLQKTFAALDADNQAKMTQDFFKNVTRFNRVDDGAMVVPAEYLEIVITKK